MVWGVSGLSTHQTTPTSATSRAEGVPAWRTLSSTGSTTLLGNVKNAITGTYHAIRGQHAPRYLAEFEYRFNRRYDLKAMIPRFLAVAVKTPPMPYRFLKMAEPYA
ncbi:hypothetical protein VRRI112168_15900 [Vreelandella rituensis]